MFPPFVTRLYWADFACDIDVECGLVLSLCVFLFVVFFGLGVEEVMNFRLQPYTTNNFLLTQSLSYNITVSAAVRLIPKPPALVLNKKINMSESWLKLSI